MTRSSAGRQHGGALATPARLGRWLESHGLLDAGTVPGEAEQRQAIDLRRGVRALIFVNSGVEADVAAIERFEDLAARGRLALRFEDGLPVGFKPASHSFDDALAVIAAIIATAGLTGLWPRLKICAGGDCGRAFFDASQSRPGKWCSTRCGERHRAAAYRRRDRG